MICTEMGESQGHQKYCKDALQRVDQSYSTETALHPAWISHVLPIIHVDKKYAYNKMNLNPNQKLHINKAFSLIVPEIYKPCKSREDWKMRKKNPFLLWGLSCKDVTTWPVSRPWRKVVWEEEMGDKEKHERYLSVWFQLSLFFPNLFSSIHSLTLWAFTKHIY